MRRPPVGISTVVVILCCFVLPFSTAKVVVAGGGGAAMSPCRRVVFTNKSTVDLTGATDLTLSATLAQTNVVPGNYPWNINLCEPTQCLSSNNPSFMEESACSTRFMMIDPSANNSGMATVVGLHDEYIRVRYVIPTSAPDSNGYTWTAEVQLHCGTSATMQCAGNSYVATMTATAINLVFVMTSTRFCAIPPPTTSTSTSTVAPTTLEPSPSPSPAGPPPDTSSPSGSANGHNGTAAQDSQKHVFTWGMVFIIVFCVTVPVYFFVGSLIQCHRGASGSNIIPNAAFWRSFLGCARDGVYFVWCKLTGQPFRSLSIRGGHGFENPRTVRSEQRFEIQQGNVMLPGAYRNV